MSFKLLNSMERKLDVMHFRRADLTNSNRDFLRHCLSRPEVEARVVLLDPESECFGAFARFIRYNGRKLYDAIDVWKTVATEAGEGSGGGVWLRVCLSDFFSAKHICLYQYDAWLHAQNFMDTLSLRKDHESTGLPAAVKGPSSAS